MSKKKKILIVEDEIITAMFLRAELFRKGYDICTLASNSETALTTFETEKPDLIVVDIGLPGDVNGIDIAKTIVKKKPDTPIIFITGYNDEVMKSRALSVKPLAYFSKPIKADSLNDIIDSYFNKV